MSAPLAAPAAFDPNKRLELREERITTRLIQNGERYQLVAKLVQNLVLAEDVERFPGFPKYTEIISPMVGRNFESIRIEGLIGIGVLGEYGKELAEFWQATVNQRIHELKYAHNYRELRIFI